ncbi:MAG: hypothetical protein ABIB11_02215 [Candidatus Omnitrophota bacterium]
MENVQIIPALLYTVMCDDVRQEINGKFMLIGLFETIGSKKFPVYHSSLFVVNCWSGGMGKFKQRTRLIGPDNIKIAEDEETGFELLDLKSKHRIIARFNNLCFKTPGEYAVEVLLDGDLKVRYPLLAELIPVSKG